MTSRFLFVGERPSAKAVAMAVSWKDGHLAAKQLFDALDACGISREACRFTNAYRATLDKKPVRKHWLGRTLRRALARGERVVAMGQLAAQAIARLGVEHTVIVHPAARGKIRKKERYIEHIRESLVATRSCECCAT